MHCEASTLMIHASRLLDNKFKIEQENDFKEAAECRLIYICFFSPIYTCEVSQSFMVVEILHTINLVGENALYLFNVVYVYHLLLEFLNYSVFIPFIVLELLAYNFKVFGAELPLNIIIFPLEHVL